MYVEIYVYMFVYIYIYRHIYIQTGDVQRLNGSGVCMLVGITYRVNIYYICTVLCNTVYTYTVFKG